MKNKNKELDNYQVSGIVDKIQIDFYDLGSKIEFNGKKLL